MYAYSVFKVDFVVHNGESLTMLPQSFEDAAHLYGEHGEHLDGDAIELIEATPGTGLSESFVNVGARLVIHLFGTIEHVDNHAQSPA